MKAKHAAALCAFALVVLLNPATLSAHCQIPCGIFGDEARFDAMMEDVTTIEKSMKQIVELSAAETPDWNQIVRWVMNKEDHADLLTETVTHYFMAQRIKPKPADSEEHAKYVHELTLLHKIMVHAMKAKQTTDQEQVETLRTLIGQLKKSYLGEHSHPAS
ncbi:MAG: superoxide dismutase [Ni] [Acidobacteriota bacterium]